MKGPRKGCVSPGSSDRGKTMNRLHLARLAAVVALTLALAAPALAWGRDGHRIVADVAAAGLGDPAKAKVAELLDGKSMAQVALWADDMRTWQRSRTAANQNPDPPDSLAGDAVALAFFND